MKLLSSTIINERLSSREIVIVSEYVNSKSKTIFRCVNNHEWSAFVNNVLKENGCPHCSNRAMLTKEQCPDGYTETLNEDKLQMILETLDK